MARDIDGVGRLGRSGFRVRSRLQALVRASHGFPLGAIRTVRFPCRRLARAGHPCFVRTTPRPHASEGAMDDPVLHDAGGDAARRRNGSSDSCSDWSIAPPPGESRWLVWSAQRREVDRRPAPILGVSFGPHGGGCGVFHSAGRAGRGALASALAGRRRGGLVADLPRFPPPFRRHGWVDPWQRMWLVGGVLARDSLVDLALLLCALWDSAVVAGA